MNADFPSRVAILYSGGTDSTASAALMAQQFDEIHLLNYRRHGFVGAEHSSYNAAKLAARFPDRKFVHWIYETTPLAKWIADHRRLHYVTRHGFMTLQNCGHCALANHMATLAHCLRHDVHHLADGITRDWPFFPGHMDPVIERLRGLARRFDVTYHTPVLHCDIDRPMPYIAKILAPGKGMDPNPDADTTGRILLRLGLSETENYKGTATDRKAQARCWQFMLPNIYIHWIFHAAQRPKAYEAAVTAYFDELIDDATVLLQEHARSGAHDRIFAFLEQPPVPIAQQP